MQSPCKDNVHVCLIAAVRCCQVEVVRTAQPCQWIVTEEGHWIDMCSIAPVAELQKREEEGDSGQNIPRIQLR